MKPSHVSIWFLIGAQLVIYGFLIGGAGIYGLYYPPERPTVLENLHPAIPLGVVLLVLGLFYVIKFRPRQSD